MNGQRKYYILGALILFTVIFLPVSRASAMRFSHALHKKNQISKCVQCHKPGAASITPKREICYQCHTEKDIEETVLGPTKTHTPLWVKEHGKESQSAGAQCSKCHSISFCVDCHKGGELGVDLKKRPGRVDTILPRTHTSRFRVVHPLKATGTQVEQCYTCHSRDDCVKCHNSYRNRFPGRNIVSHQKSWQTLIASPDAPDHNGFSLNQCQDCHPGGALSSKAWSKAHAQEARRSLASCQSCHPDGDACLACHSAKTGLMVSPHPGNWDRIQSKFRKESPEVCAKCH